MLLRQRKATLIKVALTVMFSTISIQNSYAFEMGINTHLRWYPEEQDHYLELINNYGFNSFRDDYLWALIEQQKGVYQTISKINRVDTSFLISKENYGMNPIAVLAYGNDLYDKGGYASNDEAIAAYANYAYWTAKRFKGKVKYYEIWNEWMSGTGTHNKSPTPPPVQIYFKLIQQASIAIKRANPDAIVIAGSFNPLVSYGQKWSNDLIKLGMLNYIDGISIHPYSFKSTDKSLNTPDGNIEKIDEYQAELKRLAGKEVPIYITEIGVPTSTGKFGYSEDYVAQYIVKYTLLAKSRGYIKGVWWYDLSDDGDNSKNIEHRFGLLNKNESKKPAMESYGKIADLIKNYTIKNYNVTSDGKVNLIFSNGKREARVTWKRNYNQEGGNSTMNKIMPLMTSDNQSPQKITALVIEDAAQKNPPSVSADTPIITFSNQ
ncbi:cellulase family glycosylhydrolase [Serratia marcescens]|uniref:cellulase family glycosylhydrolase n=1 Tax=Serratia marcescens TaxID=615 RepID=UPI001EFF1D9F|nr:cellulase family glycosylhydrolase [Serratia marcescens]